MSPAPSVIVFDVNETLSDMSPMAQRFIDIGAPEHLAKLWFATLLRDGFALTAAGGQRPFAQLGVDALHTVLHDVNLDRSLDAAIDHVISGFSDLGVHPDVPDGVRALRRSGRRLVTLSNGSAQVAERLFGDAGIREEFEALLSVEDAGAWKPARAAYEYAARTCGIDLGDMLLVAVHPWDIDGAARAGMATAWINREGSGYPDVFTAPALTATSLAELADVLDGEGAQ
ncbi:2-haloacid dehalogenase [Modestobacter sp. DSM 44400]|uniref:haloacid dehalogenase type II n=1 Tax=Modestobacter sp. DSM 44400 TaxID=1550230 RepID=UPI0008956CF9|nr:haloacid dehalogenase type II [Modestobacter sp. DSM 44400]SDX99011.1 2-haloacid dehalogenase [Modestobacter sp. DSM 44400]